MYNASRFDLLPAITNNEGPDPNVSARYRFMPTTEVLDALDTAGFTIVSATQGRSDSPFAKHRIDLDHPDFKAFQIAPNDEVKLRVVLFNAHNRRGRFQLHVGSFRSVCENSMVFGAHAATSLVFRHQGKRLGEDFIEGVYRVIDDAKETIGTMREMAQLTLSHDQQMEFAAQASKLRWKDSQPVDYSEIIRPRRFADTGNSLWVTYQKAQESLIRGGLRGYTTTNKVQTIKGLTSVDRNLKINGKLWDLATEYLEAA